MRHVGWTAVVTAAGHTTRFRPFSAIVPKEMLQVGHRPNVHHAIAEYPAWRTSPWTTRSGSPTATPTPALNTARPP